jgi:predicted nucleic acid-binding protein
MILIDSGPLIAINDLSDSASASCTSALASLPNEPFATTWSCLAEAMHFLGAAGGFSKQRALWQMWRDDLLELLDLTREECSLAAELMEKYQDLPMDLADATLVAAADYRNLRKVFTLDTHFFAFRLRDGSVLDILLPGQEQPK